MVDVKPGSPFSPEFVRATELIGKRWNGAIMWSLFYGLKRFNQMAEAIPGLSKNMLSARLAELESEGIVRREVYPETPIRVEYSLTEKGLALRDVFAAIGQWSYTYADEASEEQMAGDDRGISSESCPAAHE